MPSLTLPALMPAQIEDCSGVLETRTHLIIKFFNNAAGERFWTKMRSSQGNKRCEISKEQRAEIVNLYGRVIQNGVSKVFANKEFGFTAVTVERPLRLNFQTSPERLARLDAYKPLQKLGDDLPRLITALEAFDAELKAVSSEIMELLREVSA